MAEKQGALITIAAAVADNFEIVNTTIGSQCFKLTQSLTKVWSDVACNLVYMDRQRFWTRRYQKMEGKD